MKPVTVNVECQDLTPYPHYLLNNKLFSLRPLPVEAKRRSRYRGPACPVAPSDGTGVAPRKRHGTWPVDGIGAVKYNIQ